MLGQAKQGLMSAPQVQKMDPAGLKPTAGAKIKRKLGKCEKKTKKQNFAFYP